MSDLQQVILRKLEISWRLPPPAENLRKWLGNPYGFYAALRVLMDSGMVESFEVQRRSGQCVIALRLTKTGENYLQNREANYG